MADASLGFVYAVAAGILAGIAALFIAAKSLQVLSRIGGTPAEAQVLVMILLPFVAYLISEHVGASGILALPPYFPGAPDVITMGPPPAAGGGASRR